MRADTYQYLLIGAGLAVTSLLGVFFYREMFPEYKIYQEDYIALEKFRSSYSHQPLPPFQMGIKQIVIEKADKGPSEIDRCISCHLALQIPYFSPTKIAKDLNGNTVYDPTGKPLQVPNEDYIWQKLDEKIAELRDPQVLAHLEEQGEKSLVKQRLKQADDYEALKTAKVGDQVYDVQKVLKMHPLMGNETRPFEYHPIEEYGCVSCHSGNGRGLVTDRAHGPVFDGQYEEEYEGPEPHFTERDEKNDPRFAKIFNAKPGSRLIFQTTPILVGALIQAKCMNCHNTSDLKLNQAAGSAADLAQKREEKMQTLLNSYNNDKQALTDLLTIQKLLNEKGYTGTLAHLTTLQNNYALPESELKRIAAQVKYLKEAAGKQQADEMLNQARLLDKLTNDATRLLGSTQLVDQARQIYQSQGQAGLDAFLKQAQQDSGATGSLFLQGEALDYQQDLLEHAKEVKSSFESAVNDQKLMTALSSDVDELTRNYQRGQELYRSQACYACHRIAGLTRGGVGPELTRIGESYPWFIKQSIVWPQADLRSSTMPNFRLDHVELEDLMSFLLAQTGGNRAVAQTAYQADLQAWEAGKKMPWEKPIPPTQMYDLNYAMTVFATEGCAACHRLQGFTSNVGFKAEKESKDPAEIYERQHWFKQLFPEVVHITHYDEELPGSEIVATIEKFSREIDEWIIPDVRQDGLLEEINREHPQVIESMYSNFRYASRAKNDYYANLEENEKDPEKLKHIQQEAQAWKDRVHRVLMMHIQTYGLGRLIGPHLNWSGIYRSDQWLMEHFRNPAGHVPRSIMPILPFDDTKFYSLTNMLDLLAIKNRQATRQIWTHRGFDPHEAFNVHCAQCHGITFQGNGVIAEWLYPIPKNLRSADFLRNLTKEQVILSIRHGVKGTPMPPWGETASDKPQDIQEAIQASPVLTDAEIHYLVDWLFSSLPGGEVIRGPEVLKWKYGPKEIIDELKKEGTRLNSHQNQTHAYLPSGKGLYASLETPKVYSNSQEEIFEKISHPHYPQNEFYYIKKKYYTPYNIAQGKEYFLINCAVCHGNEADGSGPRSEVMRESKPRMLTDLDWIKSKDDIYLLRSIKFGVPGTSMTPWGDLTSSLQRLQLVIFIRTLSQEQDRRDNLTNTLYQVFDGASRNIDQARLLYNSQIEKLQDQSTALKQKQFAIEKAIEQGQAPIEEGVKVYQAYLEIERQLDKLQEKDQQLQVLKDEIKSERDLYYNLGMTLLSKNVNDELLKKYLDLIRLNATPYSLENQTLLYKRAEDVVPKARALLKEMEDELDDKIALFENEKQILGGKIASITKTEELAVIQAELEAFKKLKARMIMDVEAALRLAQDQQKQVEEINRK